MDIRGCPCFSKWLLTLRSRLHDGDCSQCGKHLDMKRTKTHTLCIFFPCPEVRSRVHSVTLILHMGVCVDAFEAAFRLKKRNLLFGRFDMPFDKIPKAWRSQLLTQCLKLHYPLQSRCGYCGSYEQEFVRFDHCSACQSVTYCDEECQLAHWPEHREFCELRQESMTEEHEEQKEDVNVDMCCLTGKPRTMLMREKTLLCSNPQCDSIAVRPHVLTSYVAPCTKHKKGKVVHVIATHFCNVVCQKDCGLV